MKRIGIYFFCVVAIGCVTSGILYWENEKSEKIGLEKSVPDSQIENDKNDGNEEMNEEEPVTQTLENISNAPESGMSDARFLVKEEDGYLVVYDRFTMEIYDETTIRVSDLPERLRAEMTEGLFFENEEALYAFLENYSS